jgi:hypothetical protein
MLCRILTPPDRRELLSLSVLSSVAYSCSANSGADEGWGGHTVTPEADGSGGDN